MLLTVTCKINTFLASAVVIISLDFLPRILCTNNRGKRSKIKESLNSENTKNILMFDIF